MPKRFNPPPGWPVPPPGWSPPPGWKPDPSWPKAPEGWQFFVDDAPQAPARAWYRKKRVVIPVCGLAVLIVIGALGPKPKPAGIKVVDAPAATSGPLTPRLTHTPVAVGLDPVTTKAKPIGLGTKVRDGKFEFVVKSITRKQRIGDQYLHSDAQGKFLLVTIRVTNIGSEAQTFDGSNQTLIDHANKRYAADGAAAIYLAKSNSFLEQINPGNSLSGVVVFDVPTSMSPLKIELHDSAFSGGTTVALN